MFAPLCERWSFCHDGLTRWRLLCGQHCGSSKASRRLHCWSWMTWEVENTPPPNKGDPLKKSFSGSIYNLQTGRVFFVYIDLCQPFPNLFFRLNIPPLKMQDAAQGFRATQPNTGGTTTAFPCWKLRKSVGFWFFPFVWRAFLRRQACWV